MSKTLFTKNFTLLVLGQVCSLFGNCILRFALSMYVLDTTGSTAIFASLLAISAIPTILFSPLGGILADRANRRNIMVALDATSGTAILCAALVLRESNDLVTIGILMVVLSILGAFESPTVQACVPQMHTGDNVIKGNAIVNQVAAIANLLAPLLGSALYVAFGLKPVMYASIIFFFITALFECFIRLTYTPSKEKTGVFAIIKGDFSESMRFLIKEQPQSLKIMFLAAFVNFLMAGTFSIGLPFLVRTTLGLSAEYFGIAESALGVAAIIGGVTAGFLTGKLKVGKLSVAIAALGVFLIPAGIVFLLPLGNMTKYVVSLVSFCGVQIMACIFSIFAISCVQQRTPNHLIGKIMAYTMTIALCAQPIGQMFFGLLFDQFQNAVYLAIIPTGVIIVIVSILSRHIFTGFEQEGNQQPEGIPIQVI